MSRNCENDFCRVEIPAGEHRYGIYRHGKELFVCWQCWGLHQRDQSVYIPYVTLPKTEIKKVVDFLHRIGGDAKIEYTLRNLANDVAHNLMMLTKG